jgi:hypothetical protein
MVRNRGSMDLGELLFEATEMEMDRPSAEVLARVHARLGNPGSFEESERRRHRELDRYRKKRERFLANPTAVAIEAIARPWRNDAIHGFTYFIECADYVKIGFSIGVLGRMEVIQIHNPLELRLMGCLRGPMNVETEVHKVCRKFHHRREWFRLEPELREAIKMVSVHPKKLWVPKKPMTDEQFVSIWMRLQRNKPLAELPTSSV